MKKILESNGYSYFIDTEYLLKEEIVNFIAENMPWEEELLLKKIEEDVVFFILAFSYMMSNIVSQTIFCI